MDKIDKLLIKARAAAGVGERSEAVPEWITDLGVAALLEDSVGTKGKAAQRWAEYREALKRECPLSYFDRYERIPAADEKRLSALADKAIETGAADDIDAYAQFERRVERQYPRRTRDTRCFTGAEYIHKVRGFRTLWRSEEEKRESDRRELKALDGKIAARRRKERV